MRTLTTVPSELLDLAERQAGLVSAAQCDACGVNANRRSRLVDHGRWRRPTRGVLEPAPGTLPSSDPRAHDRRRRRAAWLALLAYGPEAIAVGPCALVLLGVQGVGPDVVPQVTLPGARGALSRDGIRLRQFDDGMTVVRIEGRSVASPAWALAQAVPETGRRRAVATMDSARHLGLLDADGLARAHDLARGRRGVARTHAWWAESDARAESPLETFARLECVDAGLGPDDLQVDVVDDGRFVGRGDLGWRLPRGRWLIAEMDGRDVHSTPEALLRDRARQNALVTHGGVELLRFTGRDLTVPGTSRPGRMTTTLRHHLGRARGSTPSSTSLLSLSGR
ncbi:type IV toxin-antitoxin system AbiEi family antitoxin domain-containing protein [Cellulosimicrobium sp. TH-20]|uniref:type IV toxin-antitoxin system AbiEi family antitoxin domain-containing protein n=1 Tax=Cellulosimicrobium sp. TH-20 TaxID=1980001 RepID=UPI001582236E